MQRKGRFTHHWSCALVAGLIAAGCSEGTGEESAGAGNEALKAPSRRGPKPGKSKANDYTLFEVGPVRPVAIGPGGLIAVTNIPDDRLELFRRHRGGVEHCGSVRVGMRPVAVTAVGNDFWVVNHVSDSVSVVRVKGKSCAAHVERTLLVGDEPRDVVVAPGPRGKTYAFVTAAHRGQNVKNPDGSYRDPELTTPGIGRADVFVYDVGRLEQERPISVLTLFTDSPRALAVGDGKVYAAGFLSGNRTSIVKYQLVVDKGRQSLARLDADGDFQIDPTLPERERVIEGGYPAIKGHGRCISRGLASPPGGPPAPLDILMDVCVQTDPQDPTRALAIHRQVEGEVTPECACTSAHGELQPTPPLIVRFFDDPAVCGPRFSAERGGCWLEPPQNGDGRPAIAQAWNDEIAFSLPDKDVFTIDVSVSPPALVPAGEFRGVGTTLFNMVVHPKSGKIFVSNLEARNLVRFEGPGEGKGEGDRFANTSVRGHTAENRITVIDPRSGTVRPVHLNEHIDRTQCCAPEPNAETERSLAFPLGMAITQKRHHGKLLENQDLYVAAFGSDKVAVLQTTALEAARPGVPFHDRHDHIEVPGGPAGLALDEQHDRLYVMARFTNELVVIDTRSRRVIQRHAMHTPEPDRVIEGRRFLYDARSTSSHGDTACASCHIFGDFDGLSWDLGAPDESTAMNTGPFMERLETVAAPLTSHFLAVKGPMNTQSLRGLANHGSMHWRGDRRGGNDSAVHEQPDVGAFDEQAAFKAFNVAFVGLNGRSAPLSDAQMQAFTDFTLDITYPPNPIRNLDDRLTPRQERALDTYVGCDATQDSMALGKCLDGRDIDQETLNCFCAATPRFALGLEPRPDFCPPDAVCTLNLSDNFQTCNGCHRLDPDANAEFGVDKPGLFGTNAFYSSDGVGHVMKVPHFRNMYQKVGMFGTVQTPFSVGLSDVPDSLFGPRNGGLFAPANAFTGDQIRGFGYIHSGEEDTIFHFIASFAFVRGRTFGPPFVADNLGGFELFLPRDEAACLDGTLRTLNAEFLGALGSPEQLDALRAELAVLADPASTPDQIAAATQALTDYVAGLPDDNPGSVFRRLPVAQLSLPLVECPTLPDAATLESLGCFDPGFLPTCFQFFLAARNCAAWGSTLEQLLGTGTSVCEGAGLEERREVEEFILAFDSNLKPIVGQQVTLRPGAPSSARERLALLLSQADAGHCDVVAHSGHRGAVYEAGRFRLDDGSTVSVAALRNWREPVTFTAVPPGEGRRSGIDRDRDGVLDAFDRH